MSELLGLLIIVGIIYLICKKKKKTTNKPKKPLTLHQVELKNSTKNIDNLFVGQIVSISADTKEDEDDFIEAVSYSLVTYPESKIIGRLRKSDEEYGEKYSHAIIKSILPGSISACIICENAYLQRLKVKFTETVSNGSILNLRKEDNTYYIFEDQKQVGTLIDSRIEKIQIDDIAYISYDNGTALALIYK